MLIRDLTLNLSSNSFLAGAGASRATAAAARSARCEHGIVGEESECVVDVGATDSRSVLAEEF